MLGLQCCAGFYLVATGRLLLVAVHEFLGVVASPAVEHRLQSAQASVAAACGISRCGSRAPEYRLSGCGLACGIFPAQGWHLHLLLWQVDSLPLSHRGSPIFGFKSNSDTCN